MIGEVVQSQSPFLFVEVAMMTLKYERNHPKISDIFAPWRWVVMPSLLGGSWKPTGNADIAFGGSLLAWGNLQDIFPSAMLRIGE